MFILAKDSVDRNICDDFTNTLGIFLLHYSGTHKQSQAEGALALDCQY